MEPISILRGATTTDADGNPRQGEPEVVSQWQADVAETTYAEPAEAGARPVLIGCKLFITKQGPTGALPTDLVEVRGRVLAVDGVPETWARRTGEHRGDVITLKRKDG